MIREAIRLPPKERAAWLDRECGEDGALRQRVVEAVFRAAATAAAPDARAVAVDAASTVVLSAAAGAPGEQTGVQIGRYRLLEKIGEGGMGTVWVAEQREPVQRKVALKIVKLGMDTRQVIARFEAERQALAMMAHPDIANLLDAGATEMGRPYFVMELVNGVRITDYCDRHNLTPQERLGLCVKVCAAIHHAHQRGIIHRDIKPANVLVTLNDGQPGPKVIDFGIAKAISGQRLTEKTIYTALEEFIGTPAYMSPEQAEMNSLGIDLRSDIYALGVLVYELLTGRTPFESDRLRRLGPDEIRRLIREEEPPWPSTRLTTLDSAAQSTAARRRSCEPQRLIRLLRGDLDWIVMKCLEKDHTRRYQSAEALALDLQRHLENKPVLARRPGRVYRLQKFVRRNRRVLPLAGLTLLLAGLATALLVRGGLHRPPAPLATPEQLLTRAGAWLEHYDQDDHLLSAIADLRLAARADPADGRIQAKLGWANWLRYEDGGREEDRWEASLASSNALWLNPKIAEAHVVQGLVARSQRDWSTATHHLFEARDLTRSADGLVLVLLAAVCKAAGDASNSLAFSSLAEQEAGDRWEIHDRLGTLRYASAPGDGDLWRVRACFERAVRCAPDSPLAHLHLGQILLLQGHEELAAQEFEHSLKLRSTPQAFSALGSANLSAGRSARAAEYFLRASQADPANFIYRASAGLALLEPPRDVEQAAQHFRQALRQAQAALNAGGEMPLARAYEGLCLAALGQPEEARRELALARKQAALDMRVLRIVHRGYELLGDSQPLSELPGLTGRDPPR